MSVVDSDIEPLTFVFADADFAFWYGGDDNDHLTLSQPNDGTAHA